MNPGLLDGASQVAQTAIEAMKTAPVLIALVILQGLTLAVVGYNVNQRAKDMAEERASFAAERKLFIEQCVLPKTQVPTP